VIFASSILAARALAPVDLAIANWRGFIATRQGWSRLNKLLAQVPRQAAAATVLPPPSEKLQVEQLAIVPPGSSRVAVQDVSFSLSAGDVLGIVGPSASGKSSLTRGITGVWLPVRGAVRLDGATLDQWDPERLGAHLGYVPQRVELFDGTVAQNIARLDEAASSESIIAAAKAAGVHDLILRLSEGYETQVRSEGGEVSAGQRQRIALARALYNDPFLVVLDEPNSNLDAEGDAALQAAIEGVRARRGIVIIVAHRPTALAQVDYIMFLRDGRMQAFGPRDEILDKIMAKRQAALT
jgi:ATP-binding cassette subfamily C protein